MSENKLLNGIKKWLKTQAALMSLFLFILSIILMLIASPIIKVSWQEETINFWNNILIGIAAGLIGIIFTISFVQSALDKQATKNEEIEEYKKIVRYSKFARILINDYISYFNQVVTPTERRGKISYSSFIKDFELKDMCGLYDSTILLKDRFYTPVIERFYDVEETLSSYFLRMNEEIDFKYTEQLENIIFYFFRESKKWDVRLSIIGSQQLVTGGEKDSVSIAKELANPSKDYLKEYQEGKLYCHVMTSSVKLYYFLKAQQKFIIQYLEEIDKIEKSLKKWKINSFYIDQCIWKCPAVLVYYYVLIFIIMKRIA